MGFLIKALILMRGEEHLFSPPRMTDDGPSVSHPSRWGAEVPFPPTGWVQISAVAPGPQPRTGLDFRRGQRTGAGPSLDPPTFSDQLH